MPTDSSLIPTDNELLTFSSNYQPTQHTLVTANASFNSLFQLLIYTLNCLSNCQPTLSTVSFKCQQTLSTIFQLPTDSLNCLFQLLTYSLNCILTTNEPLNCFFQLPNNSLPTANQLSQIYLQIANWLNYLFQLPTNSQLLTNFLNSTFQM